MSDDIGIASQSSQNSCDSSAYDDLLNFDPSPSCSSFSLSLPNINYTSQLILRKTAHANSDIDSGFDFESSASSFRPSFIYSGRERSHEPEKPTSSQSTVSASGSPFNSSGFHSFLGGCSSQTSNSQNIEPEQSIDSIESNSSTNDDDDDEEMPLSGVVATDDGAESQQSSSSLGNNVANSVHSDIDPILSLYTRIRSQYSDYAFVYALAANMCKDTYPKSSHISLKTALLLSIVSCNAQSDDRPISIMAITRDSSAASKVMRNIGNCAKRFISISDDLKFNGKKRIESNSLLLARNGICFVGDWMALKATSLNYLQNVMDSGRVSVDSSSNIEYGLKCAIWMYWTSSAKKMGQNEKDLSVISLLFGIPVVLDEVPGEDVIDFILSQSSTNRAETESDEGSKIDDRAMRTYLDFVSKIQTQFEDEALSLLKYYFIVTRAIRPNILTGKSFDILHRLSECHAKLCMRSDVLKIDVIFAIELFEEFVLNTFAGQVMTKPIPNSSAKTYKEVDDDMREFSQWLDKYLANINETVNTFFQESV